MSLLAVIGCAQTTETKESNEKESGNENTLLWKISGNGLSKPSYLFGTIHLLCADDARLSDNMKRIITKADEVYFEVDIDNTLEMLTAIGKMKMRGDTTLRELLSDTDYEKVKKYFESKNSMMPFSMLEKFKPILALSTVQENSMECEKMEMMEMVIMEEAKNSGKKIKGLETMSYQAGVLDSIPYKIQADQLVSYIDDLKKNRNQDKELEEMMAAYLGQDLKKLEELMIKTDMGVGNFTEILLFKRNRNWVAKLHDLLPQKALLIAVGAGHLPGDKGVISLLRKAGYKVTPMENRISKAREI